MKQCMRSVSDIEWGRKSCWPGVGCISYTTDHGMAGRTRDRWACGREGTVKSQGLGQEIVRVWVWQLEATRKVLVTLLVN